MMWPALTLLGFLLLTAFVVAMGMTSTARYEREKRVDASPAGAHNASEPVGAIQAA